MKMNKSPEKSYAKNKTTCPTYEKSVSCLMKINESCGKQHIKNDHVEEKSNVNINEF